VAQAAKRRRLTRKLSVWFAVVRHEGSALVECRLGCLANNRAGLLVYSAPNVSAVKRHLGSKHPTFYEKFQQARNNQHSSSQLEEEVAAAQSAALAKVAQIQTSKEKFFRRTLELPVKTRHDLRLLLWSLANGVPRVALNCPLFDGFLRDVGSTAAPNRHDLQQEYLPQLDSLVQRFVLNSLKGVRSVAVSSDGWRDVTRRDWLDLGVAWVSDGASQKSPWEVIVVDLDLIPIPGSSTGDNLETLVRESLEQYLPADCLIATSTNDGAGDEQKAAFQLVQEGNAVHCVAHQVQLAIGDCLDEKKAHPPADCQLHRQVLAAAHSLVGFINGHRDVLRRFKELAKLKLAVRLPHFFNPITPLLRPPPPTPPRIL
jgi:hypothetical protein